ncbi:sugar ABC transporter permease [Thermospira aquatica]|uniref:Xylose transport system permease protein XylH n=1 Tax=Thermospira aquatica TaxID=2828656 RepID=A0AAX3BG45_9SPIR|nr:sugar ABC transporter permease [Thermospira aquatica]URA11181.1 sugar ABC transporter permease [Thermospira aquatica]
MENKSLWELIAHSIRKNIRQYTMIFALLGIWLIFSFLTEFIFLTPRNLSNLFVQTATTAILAMGMVLIIVTGNIDLSVGSVMGFCGAVAAILMIRLEWGPVPTVLVTLLVGLVIGAWHGFWIAYQKVPAFIVTLASMLAFRGAIIGITGGQTQGLEMAADAVAADSFKAIGQSYLPKLNEALPFHDTSLYLMIASVIVYWFFEMKVRRDRQKYGFHVLPLKYQFLKMLLMSVVIAAFYGIMVIYLGVPYSIILVMVLAIVLTFVANNTVFGRHLYAIGGNAEASRLSGINIARNVMILYMLMGLLTAVAGIVYTARLNAATTSAGQNAELDAIASAVIGGTSLMGGEGTIVGSLIGALVMASLDNGMSLMNLDITFQYIVKGLILLLAVWVDVRTRKKS